MKEQVARELFRLTHPFQEMIEDDYYQKWKDDVDPIINLFKAEVDKLTVIHADGCTTNLGIIGATCNCGGEAQLQHTKKQLFDLMGE